MIFTVFVEDIPMREVRMTARQLLDLALDILCDAGKGESWEAIQKMLLRLETDFGFRIEASLANIGGVVTLQVLFQEQDGGKSGHYPYSTCERRYGDWVPDEK